MYLIKNELIKFIIVGSFTVLIDLTIYSLLLLLDQQTVFSKAFGFSFGTIFAYFANRHFTFKGGNNSIYRFIIFLILYICSMFANVFTNELMLLILVQNQSTIMFAFIIATSLSAVINFIGMKFIIFRA